MCSMNRPRFKVLSEQHGQLQGWANALIVILYVFSNDGFFLFFFFRAMTGPTVSEWGPWGSCSASCGEGQMTRTRTSSEATNLPLEESVPCYTTCLEGQYETINGIS